MPLYFCFLLSTIPPHETFLGHSGRRGKNSFSSLTGGKDPRRAEQGRDTNCPEISSVNKSNKPRFLSSFACFLKHSFDFSAAECLTRMSEFGSFLFPFCMFSRLAPFPQEKGRNATMSKRRDVQMPNVCICTTNSTNRSMYKDKNWQSKGGNARKKADSKIRTSVTCSFKKCSFRPQIRYPN